MEKDDYNKYFKRARILYKNSRYKKKNLWKHVKNVEEIAKYFCENTDLKKKEKCVICLGCILHDIGKTDEVKRWCGKEYKRREHHVIGAKYLEEIFFKDVKISDEEEIILKMVKNHKGKLRLSKHKYNIKECFAVSLVRIADKIANRKILMIDDKVHRKIGEGEGK